MPRAPEVLNVFELEQQREISYLVFISLWGPNLRQDLEGVLAQALA